MTNWTNLIITNKVALDTIKVQLEYYFFGNEYDLMPGLIIKVFKFSEAGYAILTEDKIPDELWLNFSLTFLTERPNEYEINLTAFFTVQDSLIFDKSKIGKLVMVMMPASNLKDAGLAVFEDNSNAMISFEMFTKKVDSVYDFIHPDLNIINEQPLYVYEISNLF